MRSSSQPESDQRFCSHEEEEEEEEDDEVDRLLISSVERSHTSGDGGAQPPVRW
jgi:hypothetical protein